MKEHNKNRRMLIALVLTFVMIIGCFTGCSEKNSKLSNDGNDSVVTKTETELTSTPIPTATPEPTSTPIPTATPEPTPTLTQEPTLLPTAEITEVTDPVVIKMMNDIESIGVVELDDEALILKLIDRYKTLPDSQKEQISNLVVLLDAEEELERLKAELEVPELTNEPEITTITEPTPTPSPSPTPSPTPTSTPTPTPTPTPSPSPTPTSTPTPTPSPSPTPTPMKSKCKLLLDIKYNENILLAKYSINLYLDGQKIATIEHGEYYLDTVTTKPGEHTLRFEKRADSSCSGSKTIKISDDSTFKCQVTSHTDYIEISSAKTLDYLEDTEVEMPDVTEMRLDDAGRKLQALGFVNIKTKSSATIILYSNWIVTAQNIKAGKKVKRTTEIVLTCVKDG